MFTDEHRPSGEKLKQTAIFADAGRKPQKLDLFLVFAVSVVYFFTLLGRLPLADWDEAIYGDISHEFARGISHLTPFWNYNAWFEKPPLFDWLTAAVFSTAGVSNTGARAISALAGCCTVLLCFLLVSRMYGRASAWASAAVLLTTHSFFYQARFGTTDMLLALWMFVGLYGIWRISKHEIDGWYAFWIGLALGIMTKSAGVAPILLAIAAVAIKDRWRWERFGRPFLFGILTFLLIVMPWHLYMFAHYGRAFFDDYMGRHLVMRSLKPLEGHTGGPLFYVTRIAKGAFPWCLLLIPAAIRRVRERTLSVVDCYALAIFCFYTLIKTKLPWYITPLWPALAIIAATEFVRFIPRLQIVVPALLAVALPAFLYIDVAKPYARPEVLLLQSRQNAPGDKLILCSDTFILDMPAPLFYGNRPTVQAFVSHKPDTVEGIGRIDPVTNDSKYRDPKPLSSLVATQPSLLLTDRALVDSIQREYAFEILAANSRYTLGVIHSRR